MFFLWLEVLCKQIKFEWHDHALKLRVPFRGFKQLHPWQLTWQWEIYHLKMYIPSKMVGFHCHVSLPEGNLLRHVVVPSWESRIVCACCDCLHPPTKIPDGMAQPSSRGKPTGWRLLQSFFVWAIKKHGNCWGKGMNYYPVMYMGIVIIHYKYHRIPI